MATQDKEKSPTLANKKKVEEHKQSEKYIRVRISFTGENTN